MGELFLTKKRRDTTVFVTLPALEFGGHLRVVSRSPRNVLCCKDSNRFVSERERSGVC
jgi:hypothetical protein